MPRRKKTESGDGEPAPKKLKPSVEAEAEAADVSVQWEWEDDAAKWTAYSQDHAQTITDAYSNNKKDVTFDVAPKVQMKIVFDRMVQKNKKTGWERRLRCGVKMGEDKDFHVWQWEDENNRWNPYNLAVTLKVVRSEEQPVSVVLSGRKYSIDTTTLLQENISTGVQRKIQKVRIDSSGASVALSLDDNAESLMEEEEEEPSVKSTRATKSAAKSAAKGSTGRGKSRGGKAACLEDEDDGELTVKTFVKKGAAPVDPECTAKVKTAHVYCKGNDIYDAMLNQTNLSNNNNKYYLMQVLEDDARKAYSVWLRWGRVGYKGQTNLIPCGADVDSAIKTFSKKFQEKTQNSFASRSSFEKVAGKYDLVKVDYSTEDKSDETDGKKGKKEPENIPDSKLEKRLQTLIDLICDVKRMEDAVIEMKYDAKKAPLGKLTETQIRAGYAALKKIDTYIDQNKLGHKLVEACDEFYTRIPHNFGMKTPPVIRTKNDVKLKLSLLEALSDIEVAMKIIKKHNVDENPLDTHYNSLNCGLTAVDKTCTDYQMIEDYLQNTHATTHNQYKMEIIDVFEVMKDAEDKQFKDHGNKMLLWHGSRLTNWVGILSQGLRIAPPEAPVTGYMFGKGVYFADMSSKSANYCYPSQSKNECLLLLCEVSLGKCNELLAADYNAATLPDGTQSVWGKGKVAPDPKKTFKMSSGCAVPLGKELDTGVTNPTGYTLNYNEFIIYNLKQIKMKYLLRIKFNFK